jgi:hypothetical protein
MSTDFTGLKPFVKRSQQVNQGFWVSHKINGQFCRDRQVALIRLFFPSGAKNGSPTNPGAIAGRGGLLPARWTLAFLVKVKRPMNEIQGLNRRRSCQKTPIERLSAAGGVNSVEQMG